MPCNIYGKQNDVRGIKYVQCVVENLPKVFLLFGGVHNYGAENAMNTYELVKNLFEKAGISQQYLIIFKQSSI